MLSQLRQLSQHTDGRYATDAELQFIQEYLQSAHLRFSAYQKIQTAEAEILHAVYTRLRSRYPHLLRRGKVDLSAKWRIDTMRVLRFSTIALLIQDADWLRQYLLLWFKTVMQAFEAQRSCELTYLAMQEVIHQYLTPAEAALFCPLLALNQTILGQP